MDNIRDSNLRYKTSIKERREAMNKNEKDEKLDDLNMVLKSLNDKERSLDEAVKEYQSDADKYTLEAEKKENMELLKMSNG